VYLQSVKKIQNSDLLVAITSKEEADATFAKVSKFQLSDDPNAQIVNMSDNEFRATWKYNHGELVDWCKVNIVGFKQDALFNDVKREIENNIKCVYVRRLDSKNKKSASQKFYTEFAMEEVKRLYEECYNSDN
jgi:hypothetical protein